MSNLSPDEFVGRAGDGGLPRPGLALLVNVVDHRGPWRTQVAATAEKTVRTEGGP